MKVLKKRQKEAKPGRSVFCVASSRIQANRIVDHLSNAGFSPSDISLIFPHANFPGDTASEDCGRKVVALGFGLALGGVLGWLAGNEVFSMPGFGSLVACGPIGRIIKSKVSGYPDRDVKDVLVGMGISRNEAGLYQDNVKDGQLLVCFHANDWREADAARKIFQAVGASNISILGEKASALFPSGLAVHRRREPALAGASV